MMNIHDITVSKQGPSNSHLPNAITTLPDTVSQGISELSAPSHSSSAPSHSSGGATEGRISGNPVTMPSQPLLPTFPAGELPAQFEMKDVVVTSDLVLSSPNSKSPDSHSVILVANGTYPSPELDPVDRATALLDYLCNCF